jgi:hypothetical protein
VYTPHVKFTAGSVETLSFFYQPSEKKHLLWVLLNTDKNLFGQCKCKRLNIEYYILYHLLWQMWLVWRTGHDWQILQEVAPLSPCGNNSISCFVRMPQFILKSEDDWIKNTAKRNMRDCTEQLCCTALQNSCTLQLFETVADCTNVQTVQLCRLYK